MIVRVLLFLAGIRQWITIGGENRDNPVAREELTAS